MKLEWQKWLKAAETPDVELAPDMAFETSLGALQAARDGLGFALGERLSVHQRILAGSLVAPFTDIVVTGHNVKLFWQKGTRMDAIASRIENCIKGMIAQSLGPEVDPFSTDWLKFM